MKDFFIALIVTIIIFLLFKFTFSFPDYPFLRARLGTILHHSSDQGGVAHNYCYYPKNGISKLIIQRVDNGDCSNWYGQIILYEGDWVSEREKYWWSRKQHLKDCRDCIDL